MQYAPERRASAIGLQAHLIGADSPPPFEVGQVALEDLLRAFKHHQELLCRFSVVTGFLKLFEVLPLPVDYLTTPLDMTSGQGAAFVYCGTATDNA